MRPVSLTTSSSSELAPLMATMETIRTLLWDRLSPNIVVIVNWYEGAFRQPARPPPDELS
jgi:hypothetical protein